MESDQFEDSLCILNKSKLSFIDCGKFGLCDQIYSFLDKRNKYKIDINEKDTSTEDDKHGFTSLHWSCFYGYFKCVELLLKYGADVNAIDSRQKLH